MLSFIRYALKVWYRDYVVWMRYWWTSLIGALGEPLLYFLAMGYGLGALVPAVEGMPYIQFLAPALVCSTIMHSASFETTYSSYTRMEVQKTFHSIAVTPVHLSEVIAGEILWGATKSLLSGVVMLAVVVFLGFTDLERAAAFFPILVLEALLFSSLGMLMTSFAKDYDFFTYYITLFLEPLFLFSGTFFPLSSLPEIVQKVVWVFPLSHFIAMSRDMLLGFSFPHFSVGLLWVLFLTVAISTLAIRRMVRRLVV